MGYTSYIKCAFKSSWMYDYDIEYKFWIYIVFTNNYPNYHNNCFDIHHRINTLYNMGFGLSYISKFI